MLVKTLLAEKSGPVIRIAPDASIGEAVTALMEKRIGALLVTDGQGMVAGIISERDLVRGMAQEGGAVMEKTVAALMTREVVCVSPEDTVDSLMAMMTTRRIRHLPVLEDGALVGIISIGDVVKHKIAEAEGEAEALRAYIAG